MAVGYTPAGQGLAARQDSTDTNTITKGMCVVLPGSTATDELTVKRCAATNSALVLGFAREDIVDTAGNKSGQPFTVAGPGDQCLMKVTGGSTINQGKYVTSHSSGGVVELGFTSGTTYYVVGKLLQNAADGDIVQGICLQSVFKAP